VILVALNKKGEITLINRKGNQILGYKEGELLGKNWFTACVPSHIRKKIKNGFLKLMAGERKLTEFYENPVLTKSATERMMAWHNTLLKDAQGNLIGTLSSGEDITERKLAEEALRDSEERFRLAFENANTGVCLVDLEGNLIMVNTKMCEIFGYTKDELELMTVNDIAHPEDIDKSPEFIQKTLQEEIDRAAFEKRYIHKKGHIVTCEVSSSLVRNAEGTPLYFISHVHDITDRKQAEEKLRESEERYKTLFDEALAGICLADAETGIIVDCNEALATLVGRERTDLIGRPQKILHPPQRDDKAVFSPTFKQHLTDKEGKILETQLVTRTGDIKEVELKANLLDLQGRKVLQGLFHDITERKQAEEELRKSETRFRTLFEAIPDTVLVHDDKGTILHINEIGAQKLEWSAKDLVGRNLREIVTPENAASIADHIKETHKVGWSRFETTYVSRSGWRIMAEVNEHPIMFGKEKAILSVARDITERKQAIEKLRESEEKYRDLVEDINDIIYATDESGIVTYISPAIEPISDYTPSEIIGRPFSEFVYEEDLPYMMEQFQRDISGHAEPREYRMVTKSGDVRWVRTSSRPFLQGRRVMGLRGVLTEITERKQAEEALQLSYDQLRDTLIATVRALASTVEMKDQYTAGHQPRVTQLACAIAEEMGLTTEEQIEGIHMAGAIHDIGKIMVPAEILNKPGPLAEIQYEMVKMHPQAGYDILKGIDFPWPVAEIVLQHHERMDGSGYPQGLSGEEIILEAKILAVADVVEAMASHRPYRPALGIDKALEEISQNRGTLYDPDVVDACLKLFTKKGFTFDPAQ